MREQSNRKNIRAANRQKAKNKEMEQQKKIIGAGNKKAKK